MNRFYLCCYAVLLLTKNDILEPKLLRSSAVFEQIPTITLQTFRFFAVHEHLQRMLSGQSTSFPRSFSSPSKVEGKEPGNKVAERDEMLQNIVPRVLRFFAQRLVAKRDSGEIENSSIFDWLPSNGPTFHLHY